MLACIPDYLNKLCFGTQLFIMKIKEKKKNHRNWNIWKEGKTSTHMSMKVFGGSKLMHAKNHFYSSRNLKIE